VTRAGAGNRLLHWTADGQDPREDLAFEEAVLEKAAEGQPVLFTYRWSGPALVLGYSQRPSTVNVEACRELGVPVYRRCTGGTGVLHGDSLSLSLALPAFHPWAAGIEPLYDGFVAAGAEALAGMGCRVERGRGRAKPYHERSPICFEDQLFESLLVKGRKVLGCAQARRKKSVLVHGALVFRSDPSLLARLFDISAERAVNAVGETGPLDAHATAERFAGSLASALGLEAGAAGFRPASPARYLTRYRQEHWSPAGTEMVD
jgi:lipoate-protein ligase A